MAIIKCQNCKREMEHHAKQMCATCYKKFHWKPKLVSCKRCNRKLPMHAKGLCDGCYNSVFHIDKVKARNNRLYHNIGYDLYKKLTKNCIICGFDKIVELHHLDSNHTNNSETNLLGLCPNHHKMLHHREFKQEIFNILKTKGFIIIEGHKDDEFYKN